VIVDVLESRFSSSRGFRVMIFPVEGTLPRPQPPDEQREASDSSSGQQEQATHDRISREELYEDVVSAVVVGTR